MPSKRPPPSADCDDQRSRRLLGMVRGSDLYDENGELNEEAIDAFAEALNEALKSNRAVEQQTSSVRRRRRAAPRD